MKHAELLSVRDLHVQVGEKEILHGVNLSVGTDETHVLLGPTARANPPSAMPSPATLPIR